MGNLNGTKITTARLHASTHVTDLGNLGPVIDEKNNAKLKSGAMQLSYLDGGILVEGLTGKKIRAYIPPANVISVEFTLEKNSKAADK